MAVQYSYLKYKDVHTITNTDPSLVLSYSVSKVTCDATVEVLLGTILPTKTATINFYLDGNYSVELYTSAETAAPFTIKYFENTLKSFISSIEKVICGCTPCKDCEDCNECNDYLSALMKAYSYNSVMAPLYDVTTDTIAASLLCNFTDEIIASIQKEIVYGSSEVKQLVMTVLAQYYGAFYFKDYDLAADAEEEAYVVEKYKYTKIIKCLNRRGIDPTI